MFFGVKDFVLLRLDKTVDVILSVGQDAFERIVGGIFVHFGVFCHQNLARRLLRYLHEPVISKFRITTDFPMAVFKQVCRRKEQVLFEVFVKSLFHLGNRSAVVLEIMEFVERFGLVVSLLVDVVDRYAEKGRIVAWLVHKEKTVEVPLLISNRATVDVRGRVAHEVGVKKVAQYVVVQANLGIHVEKIHSFRDANSAGRRAYAQQFIRGFACFEECFAAGFSFERVVQSDIALVIVEVAYIVRRFFQKLFGAYAVRLGKVHDHEQRIECGDRLVKAVLGREGPVSGHVDVACLSEVVTVAIDRKMLANIAQDLVGVFFFFDHCFGRLGDLGRVARLDRILVGKNAICEHRETVLLDALFADDAFAAVAVFLHQRKYVLNRLFGPF